MKSKRKQHKDKRIVKKAFFSKNAIRESGAITHLGHSLDLLLLTKWPVFIQTTSGNSIRFT